MVGYALPYRNLYVPHDAGTRGGQKSVPDFLELEFEVFVSCAEWMLGTNLCPL